MSGYSQGVKRQKIKEGRCDAVDYFQGYRIRRKLFFIPLSDGKTTFAGSAGILYNRVLCGVDKIEYNNMATPTESTSYKYYNGSERLHSRNMEDWLKYSVSFTEFRNNGLEPYSRFLRPWDDNTNSLENHKRCIKALFDLCMKLGIKYWTAFDSDLIPWTDNWDESKQYWEDIVEFIQELIQRTNIKILWLAPDLHSHQRYTSGAFTSNEAATFTQAAAQIKKCLEISQRLNADCFLLWPLREGYDNIFNTDVTKEIKLFTKLLKITAEYKERLNYRCQLLIMPYYSFNFGRNNYSFGSFCQSRIDDMVNMYMWDVTSCLYLLKNYNLDRYYKVCSPPGHHMYMANAYHNMLGGVIITNAFDYCNAKQTTLMMKCILDQGTTPPGGINLKLRPQRNSDLRDFVTSYVKYIDALAKGLRFAGNINTEQMFSKQIQQRYATYYSGFGARLVSSDISMEDCEEYYKKNQNPHSETTPSKCEHMDVVFQRYLDTCDNI